jgi:hypothetical protein
MGNNQNIKQYSVTKRGNFSAELIKYGDKKYGKKFAYQQNMGFRKNATEWVNCNYIPHTYEGR